MQKKKEPVYKVAWLLLKSSAINFSNDRGMKLSAALSYYTVFSMAPLLLLMISLAGVFFGREAIEGHVFAEINGLIGAEAALQIQEVIRNMELSGTTNTALIIGAITLVIGATTVFGEIQDSINWIWKVKAKPKRGWLKLITDRLLSSSLIIGLGFLLIVTLIVNGLLVALSDYLIRYFPDATVAFANVANIILSFGVITLLFGVIFKVLPDAKISWADVRAGAFFTACLFLLGRFLIGFYLETTGAASPYGAAGSLIVILLWVYYTAVILYFGAEFTKTYAEYIGARIEPADYAVYVEEIEKEREVKVLPNTRTEGLEEPKLK